MLLEIPAVALLLYYLVLVCVLLNILFRCLFNGTVLWLALCRVRSFLNLFFDLLKYIIFEKLSV